MILAIVIAAITLLKVECAPLELKRQAQQSCTYFDTNNERTEKLQAALDGSFAYMVLLRSIIMYFILFVVELTAIH